MLSVVALFGVAMSSQSGTEQAWKEEISMNWESLDHLANFKDWAKTFGKTYSTSEEAASRFSKFMSNWQMINNFNLNGEHTYTMRLNQFGDLNTSEFESYVSGPTGSRLDFSDETLSTDPFPHSLEDIPDSIDWTNVSGKSYLTPVKDQKDCGCCWAFGATGTLEGRYAVKHQVTGSAIPMLSEQELVDCSGAYYNHGCSGGLATKAYNYVEAVGGLCNSTEYPYTAREGNCLASSRCLGRYDAISSWVNVPKYNSSALKSAVAVAPTSVSIDADSRSFHFYSGGVISNNCGISLNHAVVVVGYGTTSNGTKFWKVRNSWGSGWGNAGYFYLCRECNQNGDQGICGLLTRPSYPLPM